MALIGQDISPPDLVAKVTGRAKYAEDFRAEGMVFAKLLLSPMPHARVRKIDVSRALAMEGVLGILRADEVPQADAPGESALTDEPKYVGEPILAVAAITETIAADAIEAIKESGLAMLDTRLGFRVAYQEMPATGCGSGQRASGAAAVRVHRCSSASWWITCHGAQHL